MVQAKEPNTVEDHTFFNFTCIFEARRSRSQKHWASGAVGPIKQIYRLPISLADGVSDRDLTISVLAPLVDCRLWIVVLTLSGA